jgi:ABC-type glycerol-3-phosphate transport system substrate-binding protein
MREMTDEEVEYLDELWIRTSPEIDAAKLGYTAKKRGTTMKVITFCLALVVLGGCNRNTDAINTPLAPDKIARLKAISLGAPPVSGMDSFYKQLDALTIPELGCVVRIEYIPWGDERKQLNTAVASGEYDFVPNGVFSDYREQVAKGAFIDINQYREAAPALFSHYAQYRENYLQGTEINGGLYGVPQFMADGIPGVGEGFFYRSDLLDEWGLEPVQDFAGMEAYLYRAKQDARYAGEPLVTDNRIWISLWYIFGNSRYHNIMSALTESYVVIDALNPAKIVSRFETGEFKEILRIIKRWYDDGILTPSILASTDNEGATGLELMRVDKKPCETNSTIWAVSTHYIPALYAENPKRSYGFFDYILSSPAQWKTFLGNDLTRISVSSKSNYPEIAVKFLEKLHTDQRYYNLLLRGVLDEHYHLSGEYVSVTGISGDNFYTGMTGAADFYLAGKGISVSPQWQEMYAAYEKMAIEKGATAKELPNSGFTIDINDMREIKPRLDGAMQKYLFPLCCGVTDDLENDYAAALAALNVAGLPEYIALVQKQLDHFREIQK